MNMSLQLRVTLTTIVMLLIQSAAFAESNESSPAVRMTIEKATIDATQTFDFISRFNGEAYRVDVYIPRGEAPKDGYPALYVLDGNVLFGTFAAAARNRSQAGELEKAVIIGIASGDGDHSADRTFDFTPTDMSSKEKSLVVDLGPNPRFGGAEKFLQVIQDEIKPRVSAMVKLDPHRSALFGWSLGGLFVVQTMFEHPKAFNTYIALSPSLWRNNKAIFQEIPDFERGLAVRAGAPGFFLGVGGLEGQAPSELLVGHALHEKLVAEMRYARMVGNSTDLAIKLKPIFLRYKLPFYTTVFQGDTHNSVPWSAVNPVLSFTFSKQSTSK